MPIRTFSAGEVLTAADTNAYLVNNVAQTVQTVKTDTFTSTSTTYTDVTGLSVTITPKSSTSKILVTVSISGCCNDAINSRAFYQIVRGSTAIGVGDVASNRSTATGVFTTYSLGTNALILTSAVAYLDSPATTSATTYKIQAKTPPGGTFYVNRTENDGDTANAPRVISTITVQEISV